MMKLTSSAFLPLPPCQSEKMLLSSLLCPVSMDLGSPQEFQDMMISLRPGMTKDQ